MYKCEINIPVIIDGIFSSSFHWLIKLSESSINVSNSYLRPLDTQITYK